MSQQINIAHLYPMDMNIYGDSGNVLVLKKRLTWRGISVRVDLINPGDSIPSDTDIIVSGGGQDRGQIRIQEDLTKRGGELSSMANDDVVMLVICGTYQLFGHHFKTQEGEVIPGIGIFDAQTEAGPQRLIGNIVINTFVGNIVGYENHSGLTSLQPHQKPFGKVVSGAGNNSSDDNEGAVYRNVFGTYLHGPILPKNSKFADELIRRALVRRYGNAMLSELDDTLADKAAEVAANRPR